MLGCFFGCFGAVVYLVFVCWLVLLLGVVWVVSCHCVLLSLFAGGFVVELCLVLILGIGLFGVACYLLVCCVVLNYYRCWTCII